MSKPKVEDAAFPSHEYGNLGMSLRDYFAAKALVGILSDNYSEINPNVVAALAYKFADAMLEDREERAMERE